METMTIYIGNQDDPEDRLKVKVNKADHDRVPPPDGEHLTITDQSTGRQLVVRRADCGAGCKCALELVESPATTEPAALDHGYAPNGRGTCL